MKSISHQTMVNEEQNYDNDEIQEEQTMNAEEQVESKHDTEKYDRANVFSEKMIRKLDQVPTEFRKNYIFKVDEATRKGHQNPYKPILFGFGPYHRGKSNLQPMEEHKWQSLDKMIGYVTLYRGISRSDLIKSCYDMLEGLEDEARGYYSYDTTGLNSDEFLEMLLLDGCFLLKKIRRHSYEGAISLINERILNHDVLLLENQLPFFILEKLHGLMLTHDNNGNGSIILLQLVIQSNILGSVMRSIRPLALALEDYMATVICFSKLYRKNFHDYFYSEDSSEEMKKLVTDIEVREEGREFDPEKLKNTKHLLELIYKVLLREDLLEFPVATNTIVQVVSQGASLKGNRMKEVRNTYTVTELSNAGVKFKPVGKRRFYDIQFKNRILEIPKITVTRNIKEGIFRNLMAYEASVESYCIINDYVSFMDSIISSEKDVELLCNHGIIEHFLGDDEAVSTMFRSDYFSSPWAIISVIAAFVLLVLTIIQTVYSALSYYKAG